MLWTAFFYVAYWGWKYDSIVQMLDLTSLFFQYEVHSHVDPALVIPSMHMGSKQSWVTLFHKWTLICKNASLYKRQSQSGLIKEKHFWLFASANKMVTRDTRENMQNCQKFWLPVTLQIMSWLWNVNHSKIFMKC